MNLIVIILALAGERFIGSLQDYRRFDWFLSYSDWVRSQAKVLQGTAGVLIATGSVAVLAGLIDGQFDDDFNILSLAFSAFVLIYCLGPKTFYDQVKAFRDAHDAHNFESASWYAKDVAERKLSDEELRHLPRTVLEALFVACNQRLLGVIFWFVLLGPLGAVFYRTVTVLATHARNEQEKSDFGLGAERIAYILNWPTARLVALSYAAMGNFVEGANQMKRRDRVDAERWTDANEHLLACTGLSALATRRSPEEEITVSDIASGLALVRRSVAFWVGVIALLTLVGWLA